MVIEFKIHENGFLKSTVSGWFSVPYTGFMNPGNPNYLNVLKNTFGDDPTDFAAKSAVELYDAEAELEKTLMRDLPILQGVIGIETLDVVCVPRSKANMHESQIRFQ